MAGKSPKLKAAPKAIPPVRQADTILMSTSRQAKIRQGKKKGLDKTILAGENQLKPGSISTNFGQRTLLGVS
jgi:hypothetical protein